MSRETVRLAFELSMPSTGNGKWIGEGRCYAIVKQFTSQKWREKARALVGYHTYNFGDGWRAGITVSETTAEQARKLKRQSVGFCGYDWMVDSLMEFGQILDKKQSIEARTKEPA